MSSAVLIALAVLSGSAVEADRHQKPPEVGRTIARGLAFLARDALAWKNEHQCASCHHASLIVWSMREAKERGHHVDEPVLTELTQWIANSGDGKFGMARPASAPKAFNPKAVWYALALGADPKPDAPAREGMKRLLNTVKGDQIENGSWSPWPGTRPPIFGDSVESMTALASLANSSDPVIARAQEFLVRTQAGNGSWPMTSRPIKPGGKGSSSLIPITGAGSAWAVLGLVRSS